MKNFWLKYMEHTISTGFSPHSILFSMYSLTKHDFFISSDDISYQHYAVQYPLYGGHAEFYKATNALDRNISTCTRNEGFGLSSQHKSVWWRVDLGGVYNIYSVNILFKHYEGYGILDCFLKRCIDCTFFN